MHYIELKNDALDKVVYRGEGNSSIVIALKNQAKVIRLLKKNVKNIQSSLDHHHHVAQHPIRSIRFIRSIMKPLIEPISDNAAELVRLDSDFITDLSKIIDPCRPHQRLDKSLHLEDQFALIMDDLCTLPVKLVRHISSKHFFGPTISVEIKPKQGFLPIYKQAMKSAINDQMSTQKLRTCCLYGSTQHLKLSQGLISQTSNYCPINLFSGCPVRMKCALEELIRNPQNNFRVFKDRFLVYDASKEVKLSTVFGDFFEPIDGQISKCAGNTHITSNEDRFIDILIQCLLNDNDHLISEINSSVDNENTRNISSDICLQHLAKVKCKRCDNSHTSISKKYRSKTTNYMKHKLPQSCVLFSVLKAQKLDNIGPHEAFNMLEWLRSHEKNMSGSNRDILEELSKPKMPVGFGSMHQIPNETKQQYYFRKVWEYLVSLTAKDCSIILTMQRLSQGSYESMVSQMPDFRSSLLKENLTGNYYLFNVGVADLDQKMPDKISRMCDKMDLMHRIKNRISKDRINTMQNN